MRGVPIWRNVTAILGGELVNPPIGQALAFHALEGDGSTVRVVKGAGVVAEVELPAVAAKVGFREVVIGSDHATLEEGEEVFGGVGVLEAARGHILLDGVIDDAVA